MRYKKTSEASGRHEVREEKKENSSSWTTQRTSNRGLVVIDDSFIVVSAIIIRIGLEASWAVLLSGDKLHPQWHVHDLAGDFTALAAFPCFSRCFSGSFSFLSLSLSLSLPLSVSVTQSLCVSSLMLCAWSNKNEFSTTLFRPPQKIPGELPLSLGHHHKIMAHK